MSVRLRTAPAVAFVALLALGLSACGSGDEAGDPGAKVDVSAKSVGAMKSYKVGDQFKATEPLTMSLLFSDHPDYPVKDDWMLWKEITKRTDVTFDKTVVPMSDYEQKRSLLVGAGDAPSILPKTYPGQESAFVASGAVLPVSDYLDLMPNFQAKIKKWDLADNLDSLRQEDGKFYLLPGLHEDVWQDYTVAMRTDVLAKLGLKAPTTWDEFHDVLTAIKDAYPDSYPLSDRFMGGSLLNVVASTYGTSAGWGYQNPTWDADAGKFVYTGATKEYKQYIEYFRILVAEGLMDPESFTQDDDSAVRKFTTEKSFAVSTNAQNLVNDYRPALAKTAPGATVAKIPLPAGPGGDVIAGTSKLENGIMLNADLAKSDNFVATMQMIDWLWYSDEGLELTKWGVEGTTFTKDAAGKRVLAPDVDYVGLNPGAPKHLQKDFGFAGGVFAYGGSTELLQSTFSAEELEFQDAMAKKDVLPLAPPYPFSDAEREQVTLWETPLKDYTTQMTLQFILGQRDLSEWDKYVAELDGKGMSQYIDLVNAANKRYEKANG